MTGTHLISHASHLVRRGAEQFGDVVPEETQRQWQRIIQEIPTIGIVVLMLSLLAAAVIIGLVDYMFEVIFRVAAVETPKQDFLISDMHVPSSKPYKDSGAAEDSDAEDEEDIDLEMPLTQAKPVTSGLRSTIRHLVSVGGSKARWRGLQMAIVYSICLTMFTGILGFLTPFVAGFLGRVLLSTWEMGWTHIVITQPSADPWYRRMPPFKAIKKIAGPTAVAALAHQVAILIPAALFYGLGMFSMDKLDGGYSHLDGFKMLGIASTMLVSVLLIAVPAELALIRVQASLLPDAEEPVVSVDKTFGGRAVPVHEGGKGKLSMLAAWASYDRESFRRMVKLVVKMALLQVAMQLAFFVVMAAEVWIFILPAVRRAMDDEPSDDPTPSM